MNKNQLVLICSILIGCSSNQPESTNAIACKKVEEQLAIIHDVALINIGDTLPSGTPDAVTFFSKLTGIISQSPCGDLGCLEPTAVDYIRWEDWYKTNKDKLLWDEKKMEVVVRR